MLGETAAVVWLAEAGIFIVALVAGIFLAKGSKSAPRDASVGIKRDISETKNHYKDYRDSVHGEFKDLNGSIKELNSAYGELYNHLANGGAKLGLSRAEVERLMNRDSDFIARLPQIKTNAK